MVSGISEVCVCVCVRARVKESERERMVEVARQEEWYGTNVLSFTNVAERQTRKCSVATYPL